MFKSSPVLLTNNLSHIFHNGCFLFKTNQPDLIFIWLNSRFISLFVVEEILPWQSAGIFIWFNIKLDCEFYSIEYDSYEGIAYQISLHKMQRYVFLLQTYVALDSFLVLKLPQKYLQINYKRNDEVLYWNICYNLIWFAILYSFHVWNYPNDLYNVGYYKEVLFTFLLNNLILHINWPTPLQGKIRVKIYNIINIYSLYSGIGPI